MSMTTFKSSACRSRCSKPGKPFMRFTFLILIFITGLSCNDSSPKKSSANENTAWALLPFVKADEVNPVLVPDSSTKFFCPVRRDSVKWEEKDVFNPAAVVRDDTVFLLYRAED